MRVLTCQPGYRLFIVVALACCLFPSAVVPGQEGLPSAAREQEVAQAAAVLSANVPREQKVNACRRLAAIGGPESIAVLAGLLPDADLSHPARLALEAIPDPAAGTALQAALSSLQGSLLAGAINSLGARRHEPAVADVGRYATDADVQVASAACAALGQMGTPEAVARLEEALPGVVTEARPALGDALLRSAMALRQQGQNDEAARLCHLVRAESMPAHIRHAATRQAMLSQPGAAAPLLRAQLLSGDRAAIAMALSTSRELSIPEVTQTLIAVLSELPVSERALVIMALGDRADAAARDALVRSAQSDELAVRVAAVRALGHTGDASTVPLLLAACAEPEGEVVAAARDALSAMRGDDVDQAIAAALGSARDGLRIALIDLVGQRRVRAATPLLLPLVEDADPATRLAAFRALGQTVDARHLGVLTERLSGASDPAETAAAQDALRAACLRTGDPEAYARHLAQCLAIADGDRKVPFIELLGVVGGDTALHTLAALIPGAEDSIQDAVTRVLGQWRTPDAASALIDVARASIPEKYRVRALRGYLRIVRQMDLDNEEKLAMLHQALAAASRPEERLLAVTALGRIPTADALHAALAHMEQDPLRQAAAAAAVAIAESLAAGEPEAIVEPMRRVRGVAEDPDLIRRIDELLAGRPSRQ